MPKRLKSGESGGRAAAALSGGQDRQSLPYRWRGCGVIKSTFFTIAEHLLKEHFLYDNGGSECHWVGCLLPPGDPVRRGEQGDWEDYLLSHIPGFSPEISADGEYSYALANGASMLTRRVGVGVARDGNIAAASHQTAPVAMDFEVASATSSRSRMELDSVSSTPQVR